MVKTNVVQTKKHVIAYLDILGAQKLMVSDENISFLGVLQNEYEQITNLPNVLKHIPQFESIKVKIFSDNIIIASELTGNKVTNKEKLNKILQMVSYLQFDLLPKKLLLRGGITIGDLFINDIFVYGKALIDAYKLESTMAIYPRVITSNAIASLNKEESIIRDFDGEWFVNFYFGILGPGLYIDASTWIKKIIEECPKKDKKILQKIKWLVNYHNKCCDDMNFGDEGYLFNQSKISICECEDIDD